MTIYIKKKKRQFDNDDDDDDGISYKLDLRSSLILPYFQIVHERMGSFWT